MKQFGFGIIGCGMISQVHAAAIADIPNARLVAAVDFVEDKVTAFAEKHGCEVCADTNEMLQRDDIDIVCVCTPSGAHMEPVQAAARAGKHVICEKPIEVTLDRADALINACDENHVRLCAMFPWRFNKAARTLKAAIAAGRFGRITIGDCYNKWWRSQEYYDQGGWRGTWELDGGGACMNQGIHAIDLLQWFMGPVDFLTAHSDCLARERIEVEDTAVAVVRYKNGAMGVIECATSVYPGETRRFEIHGNRGTAILEDASIVKWEFADPLPEDETIRKELGPEKATMHAGKSDPAAIKHINHRAQIEDFLTALASGGEPFVDGREARKALEIVMAIYQSASTGRTAQLPLSSTTKS